MSSCFLRALLIGMKRVLSREGMGVTLFHSHILSARLGSRCCVYSPLIIREDVGIFTLIYTSGTVTVSEIIFNEVVFRCD